jgi:D-alanyl-lipoteichoic acid acyltransferase DltB (MBOAT superfamily)
MSLFGIGYAFYYVLNALLVYYTGTLVRKRGKNSALLIKLTLIWLIGSLATVKYVHLLINSVFKLGSQFHLMPESTFSQLVMPLGFSYIILRLIHYIVECYRNKLPEHTFWELGSYVFFFPTFLAGPIDRFERVQPQIASGKPIETADINYGLFRIISGMIKKFFIADAILLPVVMPILSSPQVSSHVEMILSIYGLSILLYMDFAGYTDMAIGVARMFGFRIVENFNKPFFQKNIALLWRNFHISFYEFMRDYFFLPLFGYRASQAKIYFGVFLTMLVTSLRHDASLHWLLLGLYHGSALVVWQSFQEIKRKYPGIRKAVDNQYADPVSIFLTFSFFSFGLIFFYFDIQGIKDIFTKLFM